MAKTPKLEEVGYIQRTHGVGGELQMLWTIAKEIDYTNIESVFLMIDGIPIPFFVESIRAKGQDGLIIKLEEVNHINKANELVGFKVHIEMDALVPSSDCSDDPALDDFVGFTLISPLGAVVGEIVAVENFSGNVVFNLKHVSGRELMVPAADDLIKKIDTDTRSIMMQIPDGLLDLFLK